MPDGMGSGGATPLKELREKLSTAERRLVRDAMQHMERQLIGAIPELLAGCIDTGTQSSWSPTVALNPKSKTRGGPKRDIKLRVSGGRVRAERPAFEDSYHLDDDAQLALGEWAGEEPEEDPDDDGFEADAEPAVGSNGEASAPPPIN